MPSSSEVVRQQAQQSAVAPRGDGQATVFDLIKSMEPAIERALPQHLDGERFARIAVTLVKSTPKLLECDPITFIGALMVSAQLGLEPGPPLGLSWIIPRYNKNSRRQEASFQLGYKGVIELFRRSGQFKSIQAHEVCQGDDFDYAYGLEDHLVHKPKMEGRGPSYAFYAVAQFKDGGHAFVVLSKEKVEERRSRGQDGPAWRTDYDAMGRKTAVLALGPWLPLSPELEKALQTDNRVFTRVEPNMVEQPALEAGSEEVDPPPAIEGPAEQVETLSAVEPPAETPPAISNRPEDLWDAKAWKAFLKINGVTEADFMRQVRSEAENFGEDPPVGLDVLKGRTRLCQLGRGWVEEMVETRA